MKNEYRLVLELSKFLDPNKEEIGRLLAHPLDIPVVLGYLQYHRMGGAAYYTLGKLSLLGNINSEMRNVMKTEYEANCAKADSFNTALNGLNDVFKSADFEYAVLNSSYLSSAYPKGLYAPNEIEILIHRKNIPHIYGLLNRSGFTQGHIHNGRFIPATRKEIMDSREGGCESVPFVKKISLPYMKYCEVKIIFPAKNNAARERNIVSEMLQKAISDDNTALHTLSDVDYLIHLCVRLFRDATSMARVKSGKDLWLYKFSDIYLLINMWLLGDFGVEFVRRVHELGLQKEGYYALIHTGVLFGIDSADLDKLRSRIKPASTVYLNEITDPDENKTYRYNIPYTVWFFSSDREELLRHPPYDEETFICGLPPDADSPSSVGMDMELYMRDGWYGMKG